MEFVRNMIAIGLGAGIGVILAYSFGEVWPLGLCIGGVMGYVIRQLTEPLRIIRAIVRAWHTVSDYRFRLKEDWSERLVFGMQLGFVAGGWMSFFCGLIGLSIWFDSLQKGRELILSLPATIALYFGATAFALLVLILIAYVNRDPAEHQRVSLESMAPLSWWSVARWNAISIPFFLPAFCLWLAGAGLWRHRSLIVKFVLEFCRLVHSEAATACGVWAFIVGAMVFLFVPTNPTLIVFSLIIGAAIGAMMKPLVLRLIPEPMPEAC